MDKYILVIWFGSFHRPYIYKANINLFTNAEKLICSDKLYLIDDTTHSLLIKNSSIDLYASPLDKLNLLTINSLVNINTVITDSKFCWKEIDSLNNALFSATVHLNDYVDEVENCIHQSFMEKFKDNIEFLSPVENYQYTIHIGYLNNKETLAVYFTEYDSNIKLSNCEPTNPFLLHGKIGTVYKTEVIPSIIKSCSAFVEYLDRVAEENSFRVPASKIEKTAKHLAILNDYLRTLSATDLPSNIKSSTKLAAIKSVNIPKLIVYASEGK